VALGVLPDVRRQIVVQGDGERRRFVAIDGDIESEAAQIRNDQMLVVVAPEPADVSHGLPWPLVSPTVLGPRVSDRASVPFCVSRSRHHLARTAVAATTDNM
jgi:hypothetical protein